MMRSLFSGVSGLKIHQSKMDVIGNNIANVNTVGFKSSSVTFAEVFYQTTQKAAGANPATGRGGTNAKQIGLGASTSSIRTNITAEGATQRTDNAFDVKINGDNFFIVNNGAGNQFTRAGAFEVDALGNLVTTSGYIVQGWQPNPATGEIVKDTVSGLKVTTAENMRSEPEATKAITVGGNINKNGADVQDNGSGALLSVSFYDKMGYTYSADLRVKKADDYATTGRFELVCDAIKDSSGKVMVLDPSRDPNEVDANGNYTNRLLPKFAFAAGADTTTTTDTASLYYSLETGNWVGVKDPTTVATGATPANIEKELNNIKLVFDVGDEAGPVVTKFPSSFVSNTVPDDGLWIDLSSTTTYANNSTAFEFRKGDKATGANSGRKVGEMTGVGIGPDGKIFASYDNGDSKLLGQIAVASFANPAGLEKIGDNLYAQTQNSGEFDGLGKDPTDGGCSLSTGVLEMSNVDLASEFTEMITTQRGFQANSKVITTSDEMIEQLVNIKR